MKKETSKSLGKIDMLLLSFIVLIGLSLRLYKINTPLADLHSWRQVDTAAVARNFVKDGFDLFHPRYDDLSSIQSGKENPEGYRFVEFPIYNAIFAGAYKILPVFSLETYGRLISIIFSLIIIAILYYLSYKESGRITAVFASLVYSVFPFFVFFSRVVLPETTAVSLAIISIFFLYLFTKTNNQFRSVIFFILALAGFSAAILVKPPAVFYGIALLYLFFRKYGMSTFKKYYFYLFFVLAATPFLLWRKYIAAYPEGIPPNDWLITSVNTFEGLRNVFMRPAFFRWIFFERINNNILGGYLTVFFVLGLIAKPKSWIIHSIILSSFTYLFVFQGGNVQHEYYQTILLPGIALTIGLGLSFLFTHSSIMIHPTVTYPIIIFFMALSLFFSYYKVKDYYNYPPELPQIAKIVADLTREEDKIITDRLGDTTLLYLTGRKGAPAMYKSLDELKNNNYQYFVTLNKELIEGIKKESKYEVVFENDKFALFKL